VRRKKDHAIKKTTYSRKCVAAWETSRKCTHALIAIQPASNIGVGLLSFVYFIIRTVQAPTIEHVFFGHSAVNQRDNSKTLFPIFKCPDGHCVLKVIFA
jgi:hypothetical protein